MTELVRGSPPHNATSTSPTAFAYPNASAPDIIRSHQKDTYFQSQLSTHLTSVLRSLRGSRFTHTYATDLRALADILYLSLTTLLGNRTLGEEYCDIVQLTDAGSRSTLPEVWRRGLYIFSSVLVPYGLQKALPAFRRKLRAKLEISLRRRSKQTNSKTSSKSQKITRQAPPNWITKLQTYILQNLDTLTSPSPIYALSLSAFYFTGAYYHLSKRLLSLRYIFTRRLSAHEARSGYEILGVLLLLQLSVQSYLHITDTMTSASVSTPISDSTTIIAEDEAREETRAEEHGEEEEVSLDSGAYAANTTLLFTDAATNTSGHSKDPTSTKSRIERMTHTPYPSTSAHASADAHANAYTGTDLENQSLMQWIESPQQRKCTLCLDPMKDPAVTTCGHVFCWGCICDWLAEKAECPLCRQAVLLQKVLPLRG